MLCSCNKNYWTAALLDLFTFWQDLHSFFLYSYKISPLIESDTPFLCSSDLEKISRKITSMKSSIFGSFYWKLLGQNASNTAYYYLYKRTGNFKLLYWLQYIHDNWELVCKLQKGNIFTVLVNKADDMLYFKNNQSSWEVTLAVRQIFQCFLVVLGFENLFFRCVNLTITISYMQVQLKHTYFLDEQWKALLNNIIIFTKPTPPALNLTSISLLKNGNHQLLFN